MSVNAANPVIGQLNNVVRQAQRDFQFATIYEQRKTNRILISGFETIAQAIYGIGDQVSFAIQNLSADTSRMLSQLEDANTRFHRGSQEKKSEIVTSLQGMKVLMEKDTEDQRVRHDRTIQKLDDIQHHRRSLL